MPGHYWFATEPGKRARRWLRPGLVVGLLTCGLVLDWAKESESHDQLGRLRLHGL